MTHRREEEDARDARARRRRDLAVAAAEARQEAFLAAFSEIENHMMLGGKRGVEIKEIRIRVRDDSPQPYLAIVKAKVEQHDMVAFAGGSDPSDIITNIGRALGADALKWKPDAPFPGKGEEVQVRGQGPLPGLESGN